MSETATGQVSASAAEVYEEFYLPALFQQWATRMVDAARAAPRQRVLDVACGTGVLARALAGRVAPGGSVVGLDLNEGMLAVARRKAPLVEWRQGRAEALPFEPESFDAVVSQFGLMFFQDRPAALREMMRVLRPGGHLAVAVWDELDTSPGYFAFVDLLQRLFGTAAADSLRAPFVLGNARALQALFAEAGLPEAHLVTQMGTVRFPSIASWVHADAKGWTLAHMIDEAGHRRLLAEAERELQRFVTAEGTVAFDLPAHIVTATKHR